MNQKVKHSKALSKGNRLRWAPLKHVPPVLLDPANIKGTPLDDYLKNKQDDTASDLKLLLP